MKAKIFTLFFSILLIGNLTLKAQEMDPGTGVDWQDLAPGEPLLLSEDFKGFEFFFNAADANDGNSKHEYAEDNVTIIPGYKDLTYEADILGSTSGKITYNFVECAFAPEWMTAYAYRDWVNTGTGENTPNVSDGFVEISRSDSVYSDIPTIAGYFEVDLREIEFVEGIQWSHSSTGGGKRGVLCKISVDDGATWDTLRYQPGEIWTFSFSKDITSGTKIPNTYRCDPSGYGMTWADGIYASNVMLRFEQAIPQAGAIQTVRIHDLKVYGTYTPPTSVNDIRDSSIKIYSSNRKIIISEPAKVAVYGVTGNLIHMSENTDRISMDGVPTGIYLVKAQVGSKLNTAKVIIK